MPDNVALLSIPALRASDLAHMPALRALTDDGDQAPLAASFPAITCPVQANLTTGLPPRDHGIIGNGFYWRDSLGQPFDKPDGELEMWTAWNNVVQQPQIWDRLHDHDANITSAAWFPLLVKGCGADYICTPAPIHNPDGSESLWCYTKPEPMYSPLRDKLGHFPLKHFWGPLAGIQSSAWIVDSAIWAASEYRPNFFYIYLPHLDYASQKNGPDSPEAIAALSELDAQIAKLAEGFNAAYADQNLLWLVASEYTVTPVDHVTYPNRVLREAGLLQVTTDSQSREQLDYTGSKAWAMTGHQHSQVFVRDRDEQIIAQVAELFANRNGIDEVLTAEGLSQYEINHARTGDVVLVSTPSSWQAYYWWIDDNAAPEYARTVDIHRKPGYDPVELFFDPKTKSIPLDATLVRGSHGAPTRDESQRGVMLSSQSGVFVQRTLADIDVAEMVLQQFGV